MRRYLNKISVCAFTLLAFAFLVSAGLVWAAAVIGIEPFAAWYRTAGGTLMLFMTVYALLIAIAYAAYGLFYALRHIRDWPRTARATLTFLKGQSKGAEDARRLLAIAALVFLFLAARTYYVCRFADGCWSMRITAAANSKAMVLGGVGAATLVLVAYLRKGARLKRESERDIEAFRAWLQQRAALKNQQVDATSTSSSNRVLLKTERAEVEVILAHFQRCFPRK
jgi:hypothetical protein